jgi:hypothetical protein
LIPLSASSEAPPKKNYGQTITLNRSLLLLPTLGPALGATLDISITLCLALLICFFEELDVLMVTLIIFSEEHGNCGVLFVIIFFGFVKLVKFVVN